MKYYIKLKSPNEHTPIWWCGDKAEWQPFSYEPVYHYDEDYGYELDEWGYKVATGWKVSEYIPSFTLEEIAKIQGGSFYIADTTAHLMGEDTGFLSDIEWVNPIIELVPVEDGE